MRALFGLVGLVVVLAIVGLLAKKQLAATRAPVPALQTATGAAAPASAPTGTVREPVSYTHLTLPTKRIV